jgi:hypothetical protein
MHEKRKHEGALIERARMLLVREAISRSLKAAFMALFAKIQFDIPILFFFFGLSSFVFS